jgi:hypothetical protein
MAADLTGNDVRLALLRVQLFTAMQQLAGDDLAAFWQLIDDVSACRTGAERGGAAALPLT